MYIFRYFTVDTHDLIDISPTASAL